MKNNLNEVQKRLDAEITDRFSVEVEAFIKRYPTSKKCMKGLWSWRGWRYDHRNEVLRFQCEEEGCDGREARRKSAKNHPGNRYIIYKCEECGNKVSEISGTPFRGMRTREWVWFFSLFLMIHLNGRRPYNYVAQAYFDHKIDFNKNNKPFMRNKKNLHIVKKQAREVMSSFHVNVFDSKDKVKILKLYSQYFGISYSYNSFEKWYEADQKARLPWKIAWCGTTKYAHKAVRKYIEREHQMSPKDVRFARAFRDVGLAKTGEWVLGFKENSKSRSEGTIQLRWFKIEELFRFSQLLEAIESAGIVDKLVTQFDHGIDSDKTNEIIQKLESDMDIEREKISTQHYRTQILHLNKHKWELSPPFKFDKEFGKRFKEELQEWIPFNQEKEDTIFECPIELLEDTLLSVKHIR